MPQMLAACEFDLAPPREIVITGSSVGNATGTAEPDPLQAPIQAPIQAMIRLLWKNFDPNRILLRAVPEIAQYHPAVMELAAGPAAVCLCENFTCQAPVTNPEDLARLLE